MLVEESIIESRVVPTDAQYAIIDGVQKASRQRSIRRSCLVAAVLIAGCAAHPEIRAFSFKVLSLPPRSTEMVVSSDGTVESVITSSAIITNAPAPTYLPAGYVVAQDAEMDLAVVVEHLKNTALLWRRDSDGAELAVSWVTGTNAVEAFQEAWRSAGSNPQLDRIRLDDRSRGLVRPIQVPGLETAALEVRWQALGGIVAVIATHERTNELLRIANSVQ